MDHLHDLIVDEFKVYGHFTVNIVCSSEEHRIAFVNFSSHLDAKLAKRAKNNANFCGLKLVIEPVFQKRAKPVTATTTTTTNTASPLSTVMARRRSRSPSEGRQPYSHHHHHQHHHPHNHPRHETLAHTGHYDSKRTTDKEGYTRHHDSYYAPQISHHRHSSSGSLMSQHQQQQYLYHPGSSSRPHSSAGLIGILMLLYP